MRREIRVISAVILLLVGLIVAALFKPPAQSEVEGDGADVATSKMPSYDETTPAVPMPVTRRSLPRRVVAKHNVPSSPTPKEILPISRETSRVEKEKFAQPVSNLVKKNGLIPSLPNHFPTPQTPSRLKSPKRIHTVIDGDTLRSLATRYLDDEQRWSEIYEMNRGILADPTSLPIGAKLTIPPRIADLGPQHASQPSALSTATPRQASRVTSHPASYQNAPASPVAHKVAKPIEESLKSLPSEPMVPIAP